MIIWLASCHAHIEASKRRSLRSHQGCKGTHWSTPSKASDKRVASQPDYLTRVHFIRLLVSRQETTMCQVRGSIVGPSALRGLNLLTYVGLTTGTSTIWAILLICEGGDYILIARLWDSRSATCSTRGRLRVRACVRYIVTDYWEGDCHCTRSVQISVRRAPTMTPPTFTCHGHHSAGSNGLQHARYRNPYRCVLLCVCAGSSQPNRGPSSVSTISLAVARIKLDPWPLVWFSLSQGS